MNEHEFERGNIPHLDQDDINALKILAVDFGDRRESDFPQIGAVIEPLYHSLTIDQAAIAAYNKVLSINTDWTMHSVKVEYNDAMEDLYGETLVRAVAVDMTATLSPEAASPQIFETRYLFILDSLQPPKIEEVEIIITNVTSEEGATPEQIREQVKVERTEPYSRSMSEDDVRMLKLLISHP